MNARLRLLAAASQILRRSPLRSARWCVAVQNVLFGALVRTSIVEMRGYRLELDPRDRCIAKQLTLYGKFEDFLQEVALESVRPGTSAIDVGANIGLHTLPLAGRVGTGKVYAFEPDPSNFTLLARNLETNGISNVVAQQVALGDSCGTAVLYQNPRNRGALSLSRANVPEGAGSPEPVPVQVLVADSIPSLSGGEISLIKVDVEGAEGAVLRGMRGILARNRDATVILEFYPRFLAGYGDDPLSVLTMLEGMGYRLSLIAEEERRLSELPADRIMSHAAETGAVLNLLARRA